MVTKKKKKITSDEAVASILDGLATVATVPDNEETAKYVLGLIPFEQRQNLSMALITLNGLIQVVNLDERKKCHNRNNYK